jgi:hypothetical protein
MKPALECASLLPLSFAGSLLPAARGTNSRRKSGGEPPRSKEVKDLVARHAEGAVFFGGRSIPVVCEGGGDIASGLGPSFMREFRDRSFPSKWGFRGSRATETFCLL